MEIMAGNSKLYIILILENLTEGKFVNSIKSQNRALNSEDRPSGSIVVYDILGDLVVLKISEKRKNPTFISIEGTK